MLLLCGIRTFAALASKTGPNLPYSADLADQRRRYGEGLIKRAPSTLKEQEEYEENEQNKVELAKRDREAERARQAEVERQKREAALRQAEELAAQRRQMIEDAKSWYVKPVSESEDEETKEKGKKGGKGRKKKNAADDGIVPDGEGEEVDVKPKKRKKKEPGEGGKRKKKAKTDDPADEGEAQEAGSDGGEAKASGNDEEDEGPKRAGGRKTKRQFVSLFYRSPPPFSASGLGALVDPCVHGSCVSNPANGRVHRGQRRQRVNLPRLGYCIVCEGLLLCLEQCHFPLSVRMQ